MSRGTQFISADDPHASTFVLHIKASVAEEERRMISGGQRARRGAWQSQPRQNGHGGYGGLRCDPEAYPARAVGDAAARHCSRVDCAQHSNTARKASPSGGIRVSDRAGTEYRVLAAFSRRL
jgi:DNA invertase Pin-like site-specific DNA recombinase